MNWRGRPLTSHEVIVNSIAATTTRTGLTVRAELDPGSYPTGTEISDAQMAAVPLARHRFHGDWNYTIHPRPAPSAAATGAAEPGSLAGGVPDRATLSHPALTGMSRQQPDDLTAELAGPQETQREQAGTNGAAPSAAARPEQARVPSSPTPTGSWPPCFTCANFAHKQSWANYSPWTAAGSPRPSAKSARSWKNTDTPSHPRPPGFPHRQT